MCVCVCVCVWDWLWLSEHLLGAGMAGGHRWYIVCTHTHSHTLAHTHTHTDEAHRCWPCARPGSWTVSTCLTHTHTHTHTHWRWGAHLLRACQRLPCFPVGVYVCCRGGSGVSRWEYWWIMLQVMRWVMMGTEMWAAGNLFICTLLSDNFLNYLWIRVTILQVLADKHHTDKNTTVCTSIEGEIHAFTVIYRQNPLWGGRWMWTLKQKKFLQTEL